MFKPIKFQSKSVGLRLISLYQPLFLSILVMIQFTILYFPIKGINNNDSFQMKNDNLKNMQTFFLVHVVCLYIYKLALTCARRNDLSNIQSSREIRIHQIYIDVSIALLQDDRRQYCYQPDCQILFRGFLIIWEKYFLVHVVFL